MDWIIAISQIIVGISILVLCIAYHRLYKDYENMCEMFEEEIEALREALIEEHEKWILSTEGAMDNQPVEVKPFGDGYAVVRDYKDNITLIKRFTNNDKEYALRCAEELRDLINEEI